MKRVHKKEILVVAALVIGTMVMGQIDHNEHRLAQKSDWEYITNWFDGYNLHPYVKLKICPTVRGLTTPCKDNATGLMIFEDITRLQYASHMTNERHPRQRG